jgi:4-hydroxy-2-oxoheptanedioate aldolase
MILSWQQIPSTTITEIMCHGFDGIVLDLEHGCFNNETLYSCIQVAKILKKKTFVRLTEVSKTMIRYCLDAGADGLIFSTIETEEQCQKIIDYSLYSPRGKRGLGLIRQNFWGEKELIQPPPILIPQIETATGVENIDKIKSFDFDFYLIGPYDLSLSINSPGNFDSPVFLGYIERVANAIPTEKMAVHIPNDIENQLQKYNDCGIKCLGMDTIAILDFNKRSLVNAKF